MTYEVLQKFKVFIPPLSLSMPTSVAHQFKIDPARLKKAGVFNAILDFDTRLFINPEFLRRTRAAELKRSYSRIRKYFGDILRVLSKSKSEGDVFWRKADKLLTFPEVKGLCIGYSAKGTSGSGMGIKLRGQLLRAAKAIIDAGVNEPEIFELVGLIEEDIGPDRISDMIAKIVKDDLNKYTARIFKKFKIKCKRAPGTKFCIPINDYNGKPIILVPEDILDTLPEAYSWEDINRIAIRNEEIRQKINSLIGDEWQKTSRKMVKEELKKICLNDPKILLELIQLNKKSRNKPYDFDNDPEGEICWYQGALDAVGRLPLKLELKAKSLAEVERVVLSICDHFKEAIEDHGLWKELYYRGKPRHESTSQRLFYAIAFFTCRSNNLDISPESNAGRGPVDFKVSSGNAKVVVELKLSRNQKLIDGYTKQLAIYQKSEKALGKYMVINLGKHPDRLQQLSKVKEQLAKQGKKTSEIILIDGSPKKSASKA